jgi:long-chain acyl-CoA synthetase
MVPIFPTTIPQLLESAVRRAPGRDAILYFDAKISFARVAEESYALATALEQEGVVRGDRLMICLQNVPAFTVALVAAGKLGLIAVPINPMYLQRELIALLRDCTPSVLIAHDSFFRDVVAHVPDPPRILLAVSPFECQSRNDNRTLGVESSSTVANVPRLYDTISSNLGHQPRCTVQVEPEDIAMLVYTSGTTGQPKGAAVSHANFCAGARFYVNATALDSRRPVLAPAPLFHVTGLTGHIGLGLGAVAPVVYCYRFRPDVVLDAIAEHRPGFTVAAITALAALVKHSACTREHWESFSSIFSGGAPIAPALHGYFLKETGLAICNVYGLTETSAPVVAVPRGQETPIDPVSGALSIGKAVPGTTVRILSDGEGEMPAGEVGEIVVSGPSVVSGYWRNAIATAEAMRPEGFRTGDIGKKDDNGWIYIVDRKKDMIVVSGFKVWPREVEDVLYSHPAVREAAVVGIADDYRGETIKAFVSLNAEFAVSESDLIAHCKMRMAAYKYPRFIEFLDDLPKTITGKILRRELRQRAQSPSYRGT